VTAAPNLEHPSYDTPEAVCGNCGKRRPNFHKVHKRPQGVWKSLGEETGPYGRLESMLRLAVALVLLVALVGATADLARGRRPVLFA
jgi:hypothetical protein